MRKNDFDLVAMAIRHRRGSALLFGRTARTEVLDALIDDLCYDFEVQYPLFEREAFCNIARGTCEE